MSEAGAKLEERVGYTFRDPRLLDLALTHRSWRSAQNNEKLEFLGDAVLDLAMSDLLMSRHPHANEGELSKRRASLVNARVLATKAIELDLGSELRLGKGEEKSGGRKKPSILAAVYEAILGAVYLDGGYSTVRELVARHFREDLQLPAGESPIDHKSRLQEITQRLLHETPTYSLVESSGPDHDRAFVVEIRVGDRLCGRGEGKSKKDAEQQAALAALAAIET